MSAPLSGTRVMVLDDEPLIALDVVMQLESHGAQPAGPVHTVDAALELLATPQGDGIGAAVLDVNLGRNTCEPVARRLHELSIPFIFHTGNATRMSAVLNAFDAPVIDKPAEPGSITSALEKQLRRAR